MVFDKNDELIIDFVSAAKNLRAYNFSIYIENKFKIKEMAGKIIPAISNALVVNLQIFADVKQLSKKFEKLRGIKYLRKDHTKTTEDSLMKGIQIARFVRMITNTSILWRTKVYKRLLLENSFRKCWCRILS